MCCIKISMPDKDFLVLSTYSPGRKSRQLTWQFRDEGKIVPFSAPQFPGTRKCSVWLQAFAHLLSQSYDQFPSSACSSSASTFRVSAQSLVLILSIFFSTLGNNFQGQKPDIEYIFLQRCPWICGSGLHNGYPDVTPVSCSENPQVFPENFSYSEFWGETLCSHFLQSLLSDTT